MRQEPIEFTSARTAAPRFRSARKLKHATIAIDSPRNDSSAKEAALIDEAFAHFEASASPTPALVANLASQLAALDRQREQLALLLRDIETSPASA